MESIALEFFKLAYIICHKYFGLGVVKEAKVELVTNTYYKIMWFIYSGKIILKGAKVSITHSY